MIDKAHQPAWERVKERVGQSLLECAANGYWLCGFCKHIVEPNLDGEQPKCPQCHHLLYPSCYHKPVI